MSIILKLDNWQRYIYLVTSLLLLFFKNVYLLVNPRIWAEEGSLYFQNAYNQGGIADFLSPNMGYYSLVNKIAAYLGLVFPVEYFPFVTLSICILIYAIVVIVIYVGTSSFGLVEKILYLMLLVLSATGEIWLNTITLQFWLCVASSVMLFDLSKWSNRKAMLYLLLTFLVFSSGPFGVILLPIFLIRFYFFRNEIPEKVYPAFIVVMVVLSTLQILSAYISLEDVNSFGSADQGGTRFSSISWFGIVKGFLGYYLSYPFLSNTLYEYMPASYLVLSGVVYLVFLLLVFHTLKNKYLVGLLAVYFYISLATILLSINGEGGLRYSFAASGCLFMWLIHIAASKEMPIFRYLASLMIGVSLLVGVMDRQGKFDDFFSEEWVGWGRQYIEHSCERSSCKIIVWPQNSIEWSVNLNQVEE